MNPRALRLAGPAIIAVAALLALIAGLLYGGGAAPLLIADPGPVVRWGLPIATLFVNLSAAGMLGSLVLALFALRRGSDAFDTALDTASVSAAVFTIATASTAFLTFVNIYDGAPSADAEFGQELGRFLVDTEPGRAWAITTIAGAVLTVLIFAARSWTATLVVAVLAAAALIPIATQGHSGDESGHNTAVTALALHILAAAVWLGGLLLLVRVRPKLSRAELADVLGRYSSIALAAIVVVSLSGIARAIVGLVSWENLLSPYGVILAVKVVALLGMGMCGAWYRRRVIGRIRTHGPGRSFWGLIALELAFMGIASGAAVALSRTPPPVDTRLPPVPSPAEVLTGSVLPPELTIERWFSASDIDVLWAFVVGFGLFFYLAGAWRLHRRGDRWPLYRTVFWVCGMLLLLWVTCGPIGAYRDYLFSVQMGGVMLVSWVIPMLLVVGAPVALATRAIRKRDDSTRGGREWILWAVHTPFSRVITHPLFAAALLIGSLWIFSYTDLFRWSLYGHLGHEWMVAHFLITGYLFVQSLIGIEPVPHRLPFPFRLSILLGVMAALAFFGTAIMMSSGLFVAEWFGSMGRTWGATPLQDQYVGGGVALAIGEIPTLILALAVAIRWSRNDGRPPRGADRQADRAGRAELGEYNARLAALSARDARTERGGQSVPVTVMDAVPSGRIVTWPVRKNGTSSST